MGLFFREFWKVFELLGIHNFLSLASPVGKYRLLKRSGKIPHSVSRHEH